MLLESSVARVHLNVVAAIAAAAAAASAAAFAAAECSCARDCLAKRHENTPYPPRTYLVDFFSISVRSLYHIPGIASPVVILSSSCSSSTQQQ